MMIPYFKYGLDISRHELPGVYVCTIGKNKRQSSRLPVSITCTIRESRGGDLVDGEPRELNADYGPIALCYQGSYTILRPWNPHTCVFAAGVHCRLVHFPIRPRSRVFVLGCPLQTLSHLADILGPTGQLIGVIPKDSPNQPTPAELGRFLVGHRHVWVVTEDIQNASAAGYELLLSLPLSSKHAFLMALHPRLGADSPARVLAGEEKHQEILKKIFSFIEFPEALKAKCLVLCHSSTERSVDTMRDVVSTHIDILQRSPASKAKEKDPRNGKETGKDSSGSSGDEDQKKQRQKKDKGSQEGEDHRGQLWVLLDLRTDHLVTSGDSPDVNSKLSEVVEKMKRLGSGRRTGMQAKEQLLLSPYFPNHSLLLLKYASHRDERRGDVVKVKSGVGAESHGSEAQGSRVAAPSTSAMPVPMFGRLGGGAAPPADAAATGGASGSAAAPAATQAQHATPGGPHGGPHAGGRDAQRSGPVGAAPAGGGAAAAPHGRMAGHHGHPGAGADRRQGQGAQRAADQQGQRQHPHQQQQDYGYYLGQLWHNEAGGGYDAGPHGGGWQQRGGRPGGDHGASSWGQGGGGAGASSGGKRGGGGGVGSVEGYAVPPLLRQMQQQGGHGCGGCGGDGSLEPGPPPGLGAAQGHWAAPPGLEQAPSHGYAPGPHGMQGGMRGGPPGPRGGPLGPRHGPGGGYDPQHQQPQQQQQPPQQRRQYPGGHLTMRF